MWIGVDVLKIERASTFVDRDPQILKKLFHSEELLHAASLPRAQKISYFAAAFAAKEAFYKAYCQFLYEQGVELFPSLWAVGRHIILKKHSSGLPFLSVDCFSNLIKECSLTARVSYSHEEGLLVAVVYFTATREGSECLKMERLS